MSRRRREGFAPLSSARRRPTGRAATPLRPSVRPSRERPPSPSALPARFRPPPPPPPSQARAPSLEPPFLEDLLAHRRPERPRFTRRASCLTLFALGGVGGVIAALGRSENALAPDGWMHGLSLARARLARAPPPLVAAPHPPGRQRARASRRRPMLDFGGSPLRRRHTLGRALVGGLGGRQAGLGASLSSARRTPDARRQGPPPSLCFHAGEPPRPPPPPCPLRDGPEQHHGRSTSAPTEPNPVVVVLVGIGAPARLAPPPPPRAQPRHAPARRGPRRTGADAGLWPAARPARSAPPAARRLRHPRTAVTAAASTHSPRRVLGVVVAEGAPPRGPSARPRPTDGPRSRPPARVLALGRPPPRLDGPPRPARPHPRPALPGPSAAAASRPPLAPDPSSQGRGWLAQPLNATRALTAPPRSLRPSSSSRAPPRPSTSAASRSSPASSPPSSQPSHAPRPPPPPPRSSQPASRSSARPPPRRSSAAARRRTRRTREARFVSPPSSCASACSANESDDLDSRASERERERVRVGGGGGVG